MTDYLTIAELLRCTPIRSNDTVVRTAFVAGLYKANQFKFESLARWLRDHVSEGARWPLPITYIMSTLIFQTTADQGTQKRRPGSLGGVVRA